MFSLTLPSFLTSVGVSTFPMSQATVEKSFYLRVTQSPLLKIVSPRYTILTSIFHHHGALHFIANTYGLFFNGIALDAGFLPTIALFVTGGLAGTAAWLLEKAYSTPKDLPLPAAVEGILPNSLWSWITKVLPIQPGYAVCGSSGAVFALLGGTLSSTIHQIREENRAWDRRSQAAKNRVLRLYFRLFNLSAQAVGLVVGPLKEDVLSSFDKPDGPAVAHSAHVGGFVFGFAATEISRRFIASS